MLKASLRFIIVVLLVLSLVVPKIANSPVARAQDSIAWVKYSGDVNMGSERHVIDASVIKDGDTYKMWYTRAETDLNVLGIVNGVTAAIPTAMITHIAGMAAVLFLSDLSNVDVDEVFDLLNGSSTVIGYATSSDGKEWSVGDDEVLSGGAGTWNSVGAPSVIKVADNDYRMWYTRLETELTRPSLESILTNLGTNGEKKDALLNLMDSTHTLIGYAKSTNGVDWTVQSSNALGASFGGVWDSVADPSVIKDGSTYRIWYTNSKKDITADIMDDMDPATFGVDELVDILDGTSAAIGYATSTDDGETWTVQDREVLAGDGGAWNSVASPSVVLEGSTYRMWYTQGDTDLEKTQISTLMSAVADMTSNFWDLLEAFSAGDLTELLTNLSAIIVY